MDSNGVDTGTMLAVMSLGVGAIVVVVAALAFSKKRTTGGWLAGAETFARLNQGMQVDMRKTPGLFAHRYPALVGVWNGQHVTVWVTKRSSSGGGLPTQTHFEAGPVGSWPPGLRVFPRSVVRRSPVAADDLESQYAVEGGDPAVVERWLDSRRRAAILSAAAGPRSLSFSDRGITLTWDGTRSDGEWFAAGLDAVAGVATALA